MAENAARKFIDAPVLDTDSPMEPTSVPSLEPARAHDKIRLSSPRFHSFLAAQFLGAANDNAFRVTLILFALAAIPTEAGQIAYASLATALFPIPFLFFSPLAGYFSDRFRKHRVLFWAKWPEIVLMAFATVALRAASLPLLLCVLFLLAMHSAFFSPAKYGILPELFEDRDLSTANGILELTTNLAILTGSIGGVYVYSIFRHDLAAAGLVYLAVACAGTFAVLFAPRAPAGNRAARFAWNLIGSFRADLAEVRRVRALFITIVGIAYFGFLGSFFLTVIPVFGRNVLALPEQSVGVLLALLAIGVGAGSMAAARLSRRHVEIGLVPLGSVGISVFALAFTGCGPDAPVPWLGVPARAAIVIALLGFSSGMFIVPLNALLQQRSPAGMKGRLVAFSNVMTFGAVLVAGAMPFILTAIVGLTTAQAIVFVVALTLAGTAYVIWLLPDFLVRLVVWLLTNTLYRIRAVGDENIPKEGALLVANHVSWVDAVLVAASCDRMVRFLMFRPYYEWRPLNWLFRMMHAIPVASDDSPEKIAESLEIAREEIQRGHVVCIFAEGSITRTGNLLKFRRGLERIASGVNCPIVPVYLDGVWGSLFSFDRGRFLFKRPKRLLAPVNVFFGVPLPSTATAAEVRQRIQELSADAFREHKAHQRPIHVEFIRRAKRQWFRTLATEADGRRVRGGAALVRALALRAELFPGRDGRDERVGILLPPGIDAILANFAVWFAGCVPVNLDGARGGAAARAMAAAARVAAVITNRRYLASRDIAPGALGAQSIFIEDALARLWPAALALGAIVCALLPASLIARLFAAGDARDVDQPATVLFSLTRDDGSPRGALLTHHNLLSNLESLRQVFRVTRDDRLLGLRPFSNAVSFISTLLLPALSGARVVFAPDLIGSAALGPLCRTQRVSLIATSPRILAAILESVPADDLRALRHVAVGGGELTDDLRRAFAEKFDVEPLAGYGCPECAPIVSLNIPDYRRGRSRQPGQRPGSAGHPLPGVSVRIVDPATFAPLPQGKDGLLLIRGPNLMREYVNGPELTAEVLHDGWFVTGEHARVDADGFLTIMSAEREPAQPAA